MNGGISRLRLYGQKLVKHVIYSEPFWNNMEKRFQKGFKKEIKLWDNNMPKDADESILYTKCLMTLYVEQSKRTVLKANWNILPKEICVKEQRLIANL